MALRSMIGMLLLLLLTLHHRFRPSDVANGIPTRGLIIHKHVLLIDAAHVVRTTITTSSGRRRQGSKTAGAWRRIG